MSIVKQLSYDRAMPQRTDFSGMACSIARTWAVIGEPWTLLILRDLAVGLRRFDQLRADLGIAPNVLADRLKTLEAAGVVGRTPYKGSGRTRHEYSLTEMGNELVPLLVAVTTWGDKWLSGGSPPALFTHEDCGTDSVAGRVVCSACGDDISVENMSVRPGPGSDARPGTQVIARSSDPPEHRR